MERDDQQLVEQARGGDHHAFRVLVERYQQRVYGIAYGIVRNEEDAMDVVQEAFVKVHRNLPRFQGTSSFYTWLYRIVVNLCIDLRRRTSKATVYSFDDALNHETVATSHGVLPGGANRGRPDQEFGRQELRKEIGQAMEGLSDKHRQVILLREIEGLSYKEIAEVLGISVGTVMSRLHHARSNLQATLRRYLNRE